MNDLRIITCRGINESIEHNMLSGVVLQFPNTEHVELPWEATYGAVGGNILGRSFSQATEYGEHLLRAELDNGPALVFGYSGGAELAGNVAKAGHRNIVGLGLVADPSNPNGRKNGIRGPRNIKGDFPINWVSNDDDVICSCPSDSPLRAFAKASEGFSLGDPMFFTLSVLRQLSTEKFRKYLFNPFAIASTGERYEEAYRDACLYLGINPANPFQVGRCAHTAYDQKIEDLAWWAARVKYDYDKRTA